MDNGIGIAFLAIALLIARAGKARKPAKTSSDDTYSISAALAEGKHKVPLMRRLFKAPWNVRMAMQLFPETAEVIVPQVKDLGLCTVLMMDDSSYPVWLVLVPRQVTPPQNAYQ